VAACHLDDRLSLAEDTRRFASDGSGRVASPEGLFVVAIGKSGQRECVFRFSSRQRIAARSTRDRLNRSAATAMAQP